MPEETAGSQETEQRNAKSAPTLAGVVRARRRSLDLRQSDLAELAGCSERFVHTVEADKPGLRLDKLLAVLGVLGLDLVVAPGHGLVRSGDAMTDEPDSR